MSPRNKTVILFGGPSGERRVSVASAQNVANVLTEAAVWFISTSGTVHPVMQSELQAFDKPFERDFVPAAKAAHNTVAVALDHAHHDTTFFLGCMHGTFGENGALQRMLEDRALAFTGSGADASSRAFDKVIAKNIVRTQGCRTSDGVVLAQKSPDAARGAIEILFRRHGRIVVKRVADGSSVGLVHVKTPQDIEIAAAEVIAHPDIPYLAEVFVRGREFTVGVVEEDGGQLQALPPSEVVMEEGRDFDFAGKYLGKGTKEITPADAAPSIIQAAQAMALDAHRSLGCRGYTRTDMIITMDGPLYLETNTLPGLTKASFLPQQLEAASIKQRDFFERQLRIGELRARIMQEETTV